MRVCDSRQCESGGFAMLASHCLALQRLQNAVDVIGGDLLGEGDAVAVESPLPHYPSTLGFY